MNNIYIINEEKKLLDYLLEDLKKTRKTAKAMLVNKSILINNKIITKYDYLLRKNDQLIINKITTQTDLDIIYEDNDILVIVKPNGLLTIGTLNEKEKTLYYMASNYVKKANKNNKIFVIHRIDKDTSGIVMFAKNENIKKMYQDNWDELVISRKYVALVEGKIDKDGHIESYLKEDNNFKVVSTKDKKNGKLAITDYKIIKSNQNYTLLDVNISTGRKNQIRVHMKEINHPIVGDKKYGSLKNPIRRLGLHAYKLEIMNPKNKKAMIFETKIPLIFKKMS